eukprot:GDKJ01018779.1.p1 GENE.GDKJ01018779.1~~GDKJ01018779.1.p1  ORF type:complete len:373 (+),score=102.36 GDKJ01018779.1:167-1120(+)
MNFMVAGAMLGASLFAVNQSSSFCEAPPSNKVDWVKLYDAIAETLESENYDDGSYGPVYVRLAWHSAGTYDKNQKNGGSIGGTIRFKPESEHGGNAGLLVARQRLEKVKNAFPNVSYADLYTFAGVVAIQEMAGPQISWRSGRRDALDGSECTPDGRLPDASQGAEHVRCVFSRMNFTPREYVALIGGGHSIGRCHTDRSGYDGPWSFSPTTFSNAFFTLLLNEEWIDRASVDKQWKGPFQYTNATGGVKHALMMLPADMALKTDPEFRKICEEFAKDGEKFNKEFASAFSKLLDLGVEEQQESFKDSKFAFYKGSN